MRAYSAQSRHFAARQVRGIASTATGAGYVAGRNEVAVQVLRAILLSLVIAATLLLQVC